MKQRTGKLSSRGMEKDWKWLKEGDGGINGEYERDEGERQAPFTGH